MGASLSVYFGFGSRIHIKESLLTPFAFALLKVSSPIERERRRRGSFIKREIMFKNVTEN